jgi:hypothetical protein
METHHAHGALLLTVLIDTCSLPGCHIWSWCPGTLWLGCQDAVWLSPHSCCTVRSCPIGVAAQVAAQCRGARKKTIIASAV